VIDTRVCKNAVELARGAKILLCESTYLQEHKDLAYRHHHLTAMEAATIAKEADVKKLIMTHFSARYLNLKPFEQEARTIFPNSYAADDLKVFQFERD
jgi:ribonuclease Z